MILMLISINLKEKGTRAGDEIVAMTTSTEKRLKAYLDYNSALDGNTWGLPKGDTCE